MNIFKRALVSVALAGSSLVSYATTVDFQTFYKGPYGNGHFSGTDSNSDGFLSRNELSDFHFSSLYEVVNLGDINQFGSFDIATNNWNLTPHVSYPGVELWFSFWDNLALTGDDFFTVSTQVVADVSKVPEPSSIALMGLGLMSLVCVRKRKKD